MAAIGPHGTQTRDDHGCLAVISEKTRIGRHWPEDVNMIPVLQTDLNVVALFTNTVKLL